MNQSRVRPLFPESSYFFGHSPFPYRGPRPGPLCGSFWSTLFHVLHDGWDISSLYSSVRCEKNRKTKNLAVQLKLSWLATCGIRPVARLEWLGGSKLASSNPPHLQIPAQMYTNTIHNATVCVHFVKKDTFMETSFVENWSKSCLLLATSTRFIASVFKKYP